MAKKENIKNKLGPEPNFQNGKNGPEPNLTAYTHTYTYIYICCKVKNWSKSCPFIS